MKKTDEQPWMLFCDHVTIVTAKDGQKENAMPATWAVSVSISPPLIAVSIAPARFTHDMIKNSKKFGVCLLSDDQMDLSKNFSSCSGRKIDKFTKFKGVKTFYGDLGVPLIEGSTACLECSVTDFVTTGDHTVFIGKVTASYADDTKKPLLLHKGKYSGIGGPKGSF